MAEKIRVLILGGGFGGLYAALEFEKRRDPQFEVTVVNRENFFLFTPMLHEIAASDLDLTNIVNPVRKMIRHVNFFCGDVDKIDIGKKRVTVSHGFDRHSHELEYDHLILALGSVTNFFNLPGVAERAHDEVARRRDSTSQSVDRASRGSRYGMRAGGTPTAVDLCRCGWRLRRSRNHREHQRFPARRASVLPELERGNAPYRTRASGRVHFAGAWREARPLCR